MRLKLQHMLNHACSVRWRFEDVQESAGCAGCLLWPGAARGMLPGEPEFMDHILCAKSLATSPDWRWHAVHWWLLSLNLQSHAGERWLQEMCSHAWAHTWRTSWPRRSSERPCTPRTRAHGGALAAAASYAADELPCSAPNEEDCVAVRLFRTSLHAQYMPIQGTFQVLPPMHLPSERQASQSVDLQDLLSQTS